MLEPAAVRDLRAMAALHGVPVFTRREVGLNPQHGRIVAAYFAIGDRYGYLPTSAMCWQQPWNDPLLLEGQALSTWRPLYERNTFKTDDQWNELEHVHRETTSQYRALQAAVFSSIPGNVVKPVENVLRTLSRGHA